MNVVIFKTLRSREIYHWRINLIIGTEISLLVHTISQFYFEGRSEKLLTKKHNMVTMQSILNVFSKFS